MMKIIYHCLLLGEDHYQVEHAYYSACAGTIILCEQPILQPPTFHVCPNEIVTYTCYDRQIEAMDWIAGPYITAFDPIKYTASTAPLDLGSPPINHTNHFYASLLNITQYNMTTRSGDLTTSLIVITDGLENGTNITCQTHTKISNGIPSLSKSTSTIILYIFFRLVSKRICMLMTLCFQ